MDIGTCLNAPNTSDNFTLHIISSLKDHSCVAVDVEMLRKQHRHIYSHLQTAMRHFVGMVTTTGWFSLGSHTFHCTQTACDE